MAADLNSDWQMLAERLRCSGAPDWAERFASYRDGSSPDLRAWRAIGGEPYVPVINGPRPMNPALQARNRRLIAALRTGTQVELLAERFGLSVKSIYAIAGRTGEGAAR